MSDKFEKAGKAMQDIGQGIQSCGCALMLLPIAAICLYFAWSILKNLIFG